MRRANLFAIAVLTILGVFVLYQSSKFPDLSSGSLLGPEFFPNFLVIILFILLGALVFVTLKSEKNTSLGLLSNDSKKIYLTIGIILVYIFVFRYLGFIISTIIFLDILFALFEKKFRVINIVISVAATVFIYVIFKQILFVPLPGGIFFA